MKTLFSLTIFAIGFLFLSSNAQESEFPSLKVKLTQVAKGLPSPVGMASPHDGTNRLFVIEQGGKIKIIKNGEVLSTPFLTVTDKLDGLNIAYSEKGLLGLAFHPDYKTNGRFFIYYSAPASGKDVDHKSIVAEYKVSAGNPDVADTK